MSHFKTLQAYVETIEKVKAHFLAQDSDLSFDEDMGLVLKGGVLDPDLTNAFRRACLVITDEGASFDAPPWPCLIRPPETSTGTEIWAVGLLSLLSAGRHVLLLTNTESDAHFLHTQLKAAALRVKNASKLCLGKLKLEEIK